MVNHGILALLILLPAGCLGLRAVTRSQTRANGTTCETPACYDIAEELEHGMNTSVDPCKNFYEYVCGTWLSKHRDGEEHVRKFEAPDKIVEKRVKEILESDFNSKHPPFIFEAITFYNQCKALNMEDATVAGQVYNYIKSEKLSKFGGWPLITPGWKESDFNLEKALIFMHKDIWVNALYDVDVLYSDGPGKRGKIQLSVDNSLSEFGRLTTSTEFWALLLKGGIMESKMETISEMAAKFYIKDDNFEESRQFKKDVKSVKKFSLQLTEIATTDSDDDNLNETLPLSEIQSTFPEVNWMNFFQSVFGEQVINGSQMIHASKIELQKLTKLLQRTNKRTIANYVIWRFLSKYTERFTDCVDGTKDAFVHAIGAVYLQRYLDQHMFDEIVGYIDDVRSVFDQLLDSASWMDSATRERAKRKLRLIKSNVGCPKIYKDVAKLKDFHKGLKITPGSSIRTFLKNVDSTFKFQSSTLKENWADRKIDYLYHEGCIATNAAYNPLENSIAVFVGIIIEPFYHPHRPLSMNYGSVGYFIGHELTHAFDQEGRAFDEYGNQANWWTNHSAGEYDTRYQCYLRHYALVAENSNKNTTEYSEYTASENIADGGGLHEAYAALKKAIQNKQSANQRLPGVMNKYSPEQLFFLSFANGYCAHFPEGIKTLLKYTDPHSMDPNRVIGNIMNSRGFAEAFKCPVGSKMNPTKKCSLFE